MMLEVLDELRKFIIALSAEERFQLEENIKAEGCRDPIIVWRKDERKIIVDGHNRYAICTSLNIDFKVVEKEFGSLEEVKLWMIDNQMGRRNLNADQLSYYRGTRYILLKNNRGGARNEAMQATAEKLAELFKVSRSTIKRDAKFAGGLNIIAKTNPGLRNDILNGNTNIKKSDLQLLDELPESKQQQLQVRNAADLQNKLDQFKKDKLQEIEDELDVIDQEKPHHDDLKVENLFMDQGERLERIKGRIISSINAAIKNRNAETMEVLKSLIVKLEKEILD